MTALAFDESEALAASLRKVLQDRHDFAGARATALHEPADRLPALWRHLSDLGLNGLVVPESHGGVGGGMADLQRVQRELGRALAVSPWFESMLCARVLLQAATAAQQDAWLASLVDGSMPLALAHREDDSPGGQAVVRAQLEGDTWTLHGRKTTVLHAGAVQRYLVSAADADSGERWFMVDAVQAGISRDSYRLVDGSWAADVRFDAASGELLAGGSATDIADDLRAAAIAGLIAEAVGMAEAALEMTVQHLRTRQQFGQPLGENQSLRHRAAEMFIALEQARSAAEMALEAVDGESPPEQAAQAQLVACEALTWCLQQAIQLHGGMGMTAELPVGHFYLRMLVINALTGGAPAAIAQLVRA